MEQVLCCFFELSPLGITDNGLELVVRRIPKFGIRIPTNLLTIWKKIRTNPDSNPNPKNRKKIRHLKKAIRLFKYT
jgi:hypothetical protein